MRAVVILGLCLAGCTEASTQFGHQTAMQQEARAERDREREECRGRNGPERCAHLHDTTE